jgi:DNA-binding MurR/RpiR family transcriptional regulator
MSTTVVLAVGMDSWLLTAQDVIWKSAGYLFISTSSVSEAIDQFRAGDFDLVLLGYSISAENKEILTSLIRASGSRTPVVSIVDSSNQCDCFADATLRSDPDGLLIDMGESFANRAGMPVSTALVSGKTTQKLAA